jgi:hypothetical protein
LAAKPKSTIQTSPRLAFAIRRFAFIEIEENLLGLDYKVVISQGKRIGPQGSPKDGKCNFLLFNLRKFVKGL